MNIIQDYEDEPRVFTRPASTVSTETSSKEIQPESFPVGNPVMRDIGVKKWNRLSISTQAITREITKLNKSNGDYSGRILTQFDSADHDRFVRDGEELGCYKKLTQGFKVRNNPFSTVPGILVFMPTLQHSNGAGFVRECINLAISLRLIRSPGLYLHIYSEDIDVPLPDRSGIVQPDVVFMRGGEEIPHFTVEVDWKHLSLKDARRQLPGPMELFKGKLRGGMLSYYDNDNWCAEVYRYVNRTTVGHDIILLDGLGDVEGERLLMREALDKSDGDFAIYLQENKKYLLLSNDNTPCENVPLSMFDLSAEDYVDVVLKENLRRPNATFWLDLNIFCIRFEFLLPKNQRPVTRSTLV